MANVTGTIVGIGATALIAAGLGAAGGAFGKLRHDDGVSGRDLGIGAAATTIGLIGGGILGLTLHGAMAARGVTSSAIASALLGATALGTIAAGYTAGLALTN